MNAADHPQPLQDIKSTVDGGQADSRTEPPCLLMHLGSGYSALAIRRYVEHRVDRSLMLCAMKRVQDGGGSCPDPFGTQRSAPPGAIILGVDHVVVDSEFRLLGAGG